MKTLLPLALLAITACTTLPSAVSCTNAPKVRAAAALALQALDRACPIDLENVR